MRYAYIKNGNVIQQVRRLADAGGKIPTSGPDAFIADFLRSIGDQAVLLLSCDEDASEFRDRNILARVLRFSRRGGWTFSKLRSLFLVFFRVFCLLRGFKPDRVLCGTHGVTLWAGLMYCRLSGVPMVHSSHNSLQRPAHRFHRKIFTVLDRWCVRRAGATICHGPYIREQLLALGVPPDRVFEFDIGFTDMLSLRQRHPSLGDGATHTHASICYVGRIEADKGVFDLLNACTDILARNRRAKLVYAGNGSDLERLRDWARHPPLDGQVELLGEVSHARVAEVMGEARVVVTPTRSVFPEARCMAAMEGLFMGVPVIAPDSGPFPYLVENGVNGLLYRTDSVKDLKRCLESVFEDEPLYAELRRGARNTAERLLHPSMTFSQAVEKAFALCPAARRGRH